MIMPVNRKRVVHPEAWVLDLDRFLIGERLYALYYEAAAKILKSDMLREARLEAEARGESFDASDWLEVRHPGAKTDIENIFLKTARAQDVLQEGGVELLQLLDEKEIPYLILTYGGEPNQRLKLRAARLDHVPHIITSTKHKAEVITTWYDDAARHFTLPLDPAVCAESIVLGDDKPVAFRHLPEQARGYLVRSDLPDTVALPGDVIWVKSLRDVISSEYYK
jgi:hypothetical protein